MRSERRVRGGWKKAQTGLAAVALLLGGGLAGAGETARAAGRASGAAPAASAQRAPTAAAARADAIDEYLRAEAARRAIPGLAWAAVDGDAIAREGYLGTSNVEVDAPVTALSVFPIASLDKQITAAGVLVLAQRGALSLDDPLAKWVEGDWGGITVRQLLAHTSGLPDSVAPLFGGASLLDYTPEQLLANVRALVKVGPPGERYAYSDANLYLAQLVTEAAAKTPWEDFVRREVFAPAGMDHATFLDPRTVIPGRVSGYSLDEQGKLVRDRRVEVQYGPLYNDLGFTARDFARWLVALGHDRPLQRTSLETMWTPVALADGQPNDETWQWRWYGLGVALDRWSGRRVVTHSGHSGVGFVYFPDQRRGVVVFTNLEHAAGSDPIGLCWGIVQRLWPEMGLLGTPPASADPDPATTSRIRAEYERLLAGAPRLAEWSAREHDQAWIGAASLAGRAPRLGKLRELVWLRDEPAPGERWRILRAEHERGTVVLRAALDGQGKLVSLTWLHV